MKLAVAREIEMGENRVALIPDVVSRLVKQGFEVLVEAGAGEKAHFSNEAYEAAGAQVSHDSAWVWGEADAVLKVRPPDYREDGRHEVELLRHGGMLIGFLNPLANPELIQRLADHRVTAFSIEMIPRSTRAQSMDALSSQASLAGYKATLIAAATLPKFFPMLTTAAGTIRPAKVFIMGAGVAGLQAIATARRLGAVVEAFDIRPVVKEQVQSLGARFVELELKEDTMAEGGYAKEVSEETKQLTHALVSDHIAQSDVVITTAQVPGKKAPLLVTEDMVARMTPGSVVVDLAADQGGNCAYTEGGRNVVHHGVTIIGSINLPASMPVHASQMYAKNLQTLVEYCVKDGEMKLDFEDEIIAASCVTHDGQIRNDRVRAALAQATGVGG